MSDSVTAVLDTSAMATTLASHEESHFALFFNAGVEVLQNAPLSIAITTAEGATQQGVYHVDTRPASPYLTLQPWCSEVAINPAPDGEARSFTVRLENTSYTDVENVRLNSDQLQSWVTTQGNAFMGTLRTAPGREDCGFGFLPKHALIAKIGADGLPFMVGSSMEFVAQDGGQLFLRINETDAALADNAGALAVSLRTGSDSVTAMLSASNGWQDTGRECERGDTIQIEAPGLWQTAPDECRNADGRGCAEVEVTVHPPDASWISPLPYDMTLFFESSNAGPVGMQLRAWVRSGATGSALFHVSNDLGDILDGARVVLYGTTFDHLTQSYSNYEASADAAGSVLFENVPTGVYRYLVSADGCAPNQGEITIEPGRIIDQFETLQVQAVQISWSVLPSTIVDEYGGVISASYGSGDAPHRVVIERRYDTRRPTPILVVGPAIAHSMRPSGCVTGSFSIANIGEKPLQHLQFKLNGSADVVWACEGFRLEFLTPLDQIPELADGLLPAQVVTIDYRVSETTNEWDHSYLGTAYVSGSFTTDSGIQEISDDLSIRLSVQNGLIIDPPQLSFFESDAPEMYREALSMMFGNARFRSEARSEDGWQHESHLFHVTNIRDESFGSITNGPHGRSEDFAINIGAHIWDVGMVTISTALSGAVGSIELLDGVSYVVKFGVRYGWEILQAILNVMGAAKEAEIKASRINLYVGGFGLSTNGAISPRETVPLVVVRCIPPGYDIDQGDVGVVMLGDVTFDGKWSNETNQQTFSIPIRGTFLRWDPFGALTYVQDSNTGGQPGGWPPIPPPPGLPTEHDPSILHKIRLTHDFVLERDAFEAELQIVNGFKERELRDMRVTIQVTDSAGNVLMNHADDPNGPIFFMDPVLNGLADVAGAGSLTPASVASAKWTLIPKPDSGGMDSAGREYYIGAHLQYTIVGQAFDYYTERARIVVKPQPILEFEYYTPRHVQANLPFKMAVCVANSGYGPARNLSIRNSQLQVTKALDQEAGPLNSFELIGLAVAGNVLPPEGTMFFGDLSPGDRRMGHWTMQADPGGEFQSVDVNYTHSAALGGEMTSLIRNVQTGIIERDTVWLGVSGGPDRNGVLVDADMDGYPDHILDPINADRIPVSMIQPTVTKVPSYGVSVMQVEVPHAVDWQYFSVASPFGYAMGPKSVIVDGGRALDPRNYWMRDGDLHVLDRNGSSYEIVFWRASAPTTSATMQLDGARYVGTNAQATVRVWDVDEDLTYGPNNDVVAVCVSSDSDPAGETLWLRESPAEARVFAGKLAFEEKLSPSNGAVFVTDGDLVSVRYIDAADENGESRELTVRALWYSQAAPTAPTDLTVEQPPRYDRIALSWGAAERAAGYQIHYGAAGGQYTQHLDVGESLTGNVFDLPSGIPYSFAVLAYDLQGRPGPLSGAVEAFVQPVFLAVTSAHGSVAPLAGTHAFDLGSDVTCSVLASPLTNGMARYVCTGWTGTGSVPANDRGTSVTFALTNDSSIVWNWTTQYLLSASADTGGTVSSPDGWYEPDCVATPLVATPDEGARFLYWADGDRTFVDNPLSLKMNRGYSLTAYFYIAYYVDAASGSDTNDGLSWQSAKATIQSALALATRGDTVLVSNGVYNVGGSAVGGGVSNRVAITNAVTVQSVNGYRHTVIVGTGPVGPGAVRCAYLSSGAELIGFTLTNGYTQATGEWTTHDVGGGVYMAAGASIRQCRIVGNVAWEDGGGAYGGHLENCLIEGNTARRGGGVFASTLLHCTVVENKATVTGGGASESHAQNSILYYNTAPDPTANWHGGSAVCSCTIPEAGGSGNITNTPEFADMAAGDWSLWHTSPCLDAGTAGALSVDLDSNLRPQPKVVRGTPRYDMGAFEFTPWPRNTLYVWDQGSHIPPYTNWGNAAINIADAVSVATNGDTVVIMGGSYRIGSQIRIPGVIRVFGLLGPEQTIVDGAGLDRCFTLDHAEAVIERLTITGGRADHGGGVLNHGGMVRDCLIVGNVATDPAGRGGGVLNQGGKIVNCVVVSNSAYHGGGIYSEGGRIESCDIGANRGMGGTGGGVAIFDETTMLGCTVTDNDNETGGGVYSEQSRLLAISVTDNHATLDGGGVYAGNTSLVERCVVGTNRAGRSGGGIYQANASEARTCLITANEAEIDGGGIYGGTEAAMRNITVCDNTAGNAGGGAFVSDAALVRNSIIRFNDAPIDADLALLSTVTVVDFTCTWPFIQGVGNMTNDPGFATDGEYRLTALSPCIDAGTNEIWMMKTYDIDGQMRLWMNAVDLGADETVVEAVGLTASNPPSVEWCTPVGGRYQSQVCDTLEAWANVQGVVTSTQSRTSITYSNTVDRCFFRLIWLR
jgi:hypothetical protein